MSAHHFLTRLLMIIVMVGCVLGLMNLTGSNSDSRSANHAEDGGHTAHPTTQAARIEMMATHWDGAVNFYMPYAALAPLSAPDSAQLDIRFNPGDDYWGLPRSEGVDTVAGLCGVCHSLAIVMQQRQSEEGWNYLFDWMIEKQGMAPIAGEMRDDIITYLSREFGQE